MSKIRSIYTRVEIELTDFRDEDLIDELRSRDILIDIQKVYQKFEDDLIAIRTAIREHRIGDALAFLDRSIEPKWKSADECQEKYAIARKAA